MKNDQNPDQSDAQNLNQNKGQRAGLRPWLKVLLALSLALNLAVIGLGAGAAWRFNGRAHELGGPPMLGRFLFKDIGRHEIRRLLKDQAGEGGTARARRRAEMEQVIALVRADTLDIAAVDVVLDTHVVETSSFLRSVAASWGQRLQSLSFQERQNLADRMQRLLDHKSRDHNGPRRDH